jgi:hypothetical protein
MIPKSVERLRDGSNVLQDVKADVRASAKLLFARHVEALLREFATQDRSSWNDDENEYWTIFNCNPDATGKGVSVFIG